MDDRSIGVRQVAQEDWRDALALLFCELPDDLRERQLTATLEQFQADPSSATGLLGTGSGGERQGVIWIQLQAGRVASLWPPQTARDIMAYDGERIARTLLDATCELAGRGGARMIQVLLATDAGLSAERLRSGGFEHAADLLYLVSPTSAFPTTSPEGGLDYAALSPADAARFKEIIERTYRGTRDCPRLNGVRPTAEVIEGYRAVGDFDPANWLIAKDHGTDVGCLILAPHCKERIYELVYMGVVPEARGRGFGRALARQAQWLARRSGAERLVLAVDAANEPALRGYAAAGFVAWDRRSVFLKLPSIVPAP
jgi:ribosomal protein S18 acetylase RimI-like enzyme